MKKALLTAAALIALSAPAFADGYDLTVKSVNELNSAAGATASGDLEVFYDLSADAFVTRTAYPYEDVTAANTLTAVECGKTFTINSATGFATTLHDPTAGCFYKFIIATDSTGTNHTIITDGDEDIKGIGFESEVDTGDDGPLSSAADTITFNSANTYAGDMIELYSDGTNWFSIAFSSSDGAIAYSSAI